jgi:Domain of unknown function (DUF1918)
MQAKVGDQIVVHGRRAGQPDRRGTVTDVRGESGGPPFMVRWQDSDHDDLFFPGTDATVVSP